MAQIVDTIPDRRLSQRGEVLLADESHWSHEPYVPRGGCRQGNKAKVPGPATRQSTPRFGALPLSPQKMEGQRAPRGTSKLFIELLHPLHQRVPEAVMVLILDHAKLHTRHLVQRFVKQHAWRVLEHLAPYSPEYNPIERCWTWLKAKVYGASTLATLEEVEAWGQKHASLSLFGDKPARRRRDAPRRWYGRSITRAVEREDDEGRIALAPVRFVAVYATQVAQQHAEAYSKAQVREAEAVAEHGAQVQRRRFACEAEAAAANAEYEGCGRGQRGRHPCQWCAHEVRYHVESQRQRQPRRPRGRPRQAEAVAPERVYRLHVTTQVLSPPVATVGWRVLATTVSEPTCNDAEIRRA